MNTVFAPSFYHRLSTVVDKSFCVAHTADMSNTAEQTATPLDKLLTEKDVSKILQVPCPTLQLWRHRGTGPPFVKLGRLVRYRREEVDGWVGRGERG